MPQDKKLQRFLSTIYDQAAHDGQVLSDAITEKREAFIAAAEDEVLAEVYEYVRSKTTRIRTDAGRRVSGHMFGLKRELYRVRTGIADEVNAEVRRRVEQYIASDKYPDALVRIALRAARELAGEGLEIFLRADDMEHAEAIENLTRARVKVGDIKLGGLVAQNQARHLRLDLSYDGAMDGIAERFGELSDFTLNQEV